MGTFMRIWVLGLCAVGCAPDEDPAGGPDPSFDGADRDGDGILDSFEGEDDPDGDGVPSADDLDADGDCIPDRIEGGVRFDGQAPLDHDGDGTPDFLDLESDGNAIPDAVEADRCQNPADLDGDGVGDWIDTDNDGDGLLDTVDGVESDPDDDALPNYIDVDSDDDCLADSDEAADGVTVDTDGDGLADFVDTDSDGDGTPDEVEAASVCTSPADLDQDGLADHIDPDTDGDGLQDDEEAALGTRHNVRDTDGDGYTDGLEVYADTDPFNAARVPNGIIVETGPRSVTEVGGEYAVEHRTDVFILLDLAYSYSCYHPTIPDFIAEVVEQLFEAIPDVAIGLGTYDDYALPNWARTGGDPYTMEHQISTDQESVIDSAEHLVWAYGGDDKGSGFEAIGQALGGTGLDMNCDTRLGSADILPLHADAADPFHGTAGGAYDPDVEGSGTKEGVAWRAGSKEVVLLTADNVLRDETRDDPMPTSTCPGVIGRTDSAAMMLERGAKLLAINVYEWQATDDSVQNHLEGYALEVNSKIDRDGDGAKDDPAVLTSGTWNWPETSVVVDAIEDLTNFDYLENLYVELGEDPNGWLTDLDPSTPVKDLEDGDVLDYGFLVSTVAPLIADDQFYGASVRLMSTKSADGNEREPEMIEEIPVWVLIHPGR